MSLCFVVMFTSHPSRLFFFFNDTATTEIYPLSLHDALPISAIFLACWTATMWIGENILRPLLTAHQAEVSTLAIFVGAIGGAAAFGILGLVIGPVLLSFVVALRSEGHTSELQSQSNLVCRLLLEKKKISSCRWRHV